MKSNKTSKNKSKRGCPSIIENKVKRKKVSEKNSTLKHKKGLSQKKVGQNLRIDRSRKVNKTAKLCQTQAQKVSEEDSLIDLNLNDEVSELEMVAAEEAMNHSFPSAISTQGLDEEILNIIKNYDTLGIITETELLSHIEIGEEISIIEDSNLMTHGNLFEQNKIILRQSDATIEERRRKLDSELALIKNLQNYSTYKTFGSYFRVKSLDSSSITSTFSTTFQFLNEEEWKNLIFIEKVIYTWLISTETIDLKEFEKIIYERLKSFYLENYYYLEKVIPIRQLRISKLLLIFEDVLKSTKLKILSLMQFSVELSLNTYYCYIKTITEMIAKKSFLIDMLKNHMNEQINVARHIDETCVLGLKPLRTSLIVPYFKTGKSHNSSPPIFKMDDVFITTKQKWTPRDCKLLIESIVESYRNEKLQFAFFIFRNLVSKDSDRYFQDENLKLDDVILDAINTENGAVEKKRKRGSKGKKASSNFTQAELDKMRERAKKIFLEPTSNDSVSFENLVPLFSSKQHCESFYNRIQMDINKINFNSICREKINVFNWNDISRLLMEKTKKLRTADDCRLGYEFSSDPRISNTAKRWSAADKKKLHSLAKDINLSWKEIAEKVGHGKTEFYSFYKLRSTMEFGGKMIWTDEKDKILCKKVTELNGNWNKTAIHLGDKFATKKNIIERFKKTQNPILRFGKFTRTEDCLLMLTIEHLKAHFNREKHFGVLTSYLPWRYESAWRDRAENIFAEYIVPWTIDEDRMLLDLAEKMTGKKDYWSKIAKQFDSFKTRKGCLTRWKILEKGINKFGTLEKYHHSYSLIRYNIQQYPHLEEISELLTNVLRAKKFPFEGLKRHQPPTDTELENFILSYDKGVVERTIKSIRAYVEKRNAFWEEWRKKSGVERGIKMRSHGRDPRKK